VAAAAQDQRPVKDRGMDQQVSARLDHQLDAVARATTVLRGRRRGGAGRANCVATRASGGGQRSRSDGQREHAGKYDRAPPLPSAARPHALTSPPGLLPGPGLTLGPRRSPNHHHDPARWRETGLQPERSDRRAQAPGRPAAASAPMWVPRTVSPYAAVWASSWSSPPPRLAEPARSMTSGLLPGSRTGASTRDRSARIVPFCGFAADRQLVAETAHIGSARVLSAFRRHLA
jgi:hypothetical protein